MGIVKAKVVNGPRITGAHKIRSIGVKHWGLIPISQIVVVIRGSDANVLDPIYGGCVVGKGGVVRYGIA